MLHMVLATPLHSRCETFDLFTFSSRQDAKTLQLHDLAEGCRAHRCSQKITIRLDLPLFMYITQRAVGKNTTHLQAFHGPEGRDI